MSAETVEPRKTHTLKLVEDMGLVILQDFRTIGYDDKVWALSCQERGGLSVITFYVDEDIDNIEMAIAERRDGKYIGSGRMFISRPEWVTKATKKEGS